jgi:enoyl-CoA hydratase/carnithine racemase
MYLILTGDRMSAEQALRCGLVHEVVEREHLLTRSVEIARLIVDNHPLGVEGARAIARHAVERDAAGTRALADWVGRSVRNSRDTAEGALAFAEKRDPTFGRP